jgi:hypothetical protein
MAVLHRALFTWCVALVFVIALVLRLEAKVLWNWFIIFIPLWIFDSLILIYLMFQMITHCKNGYDRNELTMVRKVWFLTALTLKLGFQVFLCIRLQYFQQVPLYYVMLPLWLLLIGGIVDVFKSLLFLSRRSTSCWQSTSGRRPSNPGTTVPFSSTASFDRFYQRVDAALLRGNISNSIDSFESL